MTTRTPTPTPPGSAPAPPLRWWTGRGRFAVVAVAGLVLLLVAVAASALGGRRPPAVPRAAAAAPSQPSVPALPTASTAPSTADSPSTEAPPPPSPTKAVPGLPPADSFFGPGNFWRSTVTDAPVAANSHDLVANLAHQVSSVYGGVAAFNAYRYDVAFYTVGADQPRADVHWDDCQHKGAVPDGLPDQFAQVPVPDDAVPSPGTDSTLSIYSPSLDKVWDLWVAHKEADGWHACWGGRLDDVSTTPNGYFSGGFGASGSGMAHFAGAVGIADVKAGAINHVLDLAVPTIAPWDHYSWPAQRSDGAPTDAAPDAIPDGTRFRLDPSVNVDALHLTPVARLVARAAQKYGFVVTDRASAVSVIGESGLGMKVETGKDPWDKILGGVPDYLVMRNFPWDKLQAMPLDFGKP